MATPAQTAFLASGLTYEYVARVVNLSPGYLKTQLRTGCQCYITAERLRRVLNCPVEYFLPKPRTKERGGPPKQTAPRSSNSRN